MKQVEIFKNGRVAVDMDIHGYIHGYKTPLIFGSQVDLEG